MAETSTADHEGQGGSYFIDKNGVKTLVFRTEPAAPAQSPTPEQQKEDDQ